MFTVTEGRSCYTHFIDKETKTQGGKVTQRSHIAPRCQVRTPTQPAQWLWVPVLLVHLVLPLEHEADTSSSLETEKCISSFLLSCSAEPLRNTYLKFLSNSHWRYAIFIKLANGQPNKNYIKVVHNGPSAFHNNVSCVPSWRKLVSGGKRWPDTLAFFPGRPT